MNYPHKKSTFDCPRRMDMTVSLMSFAGRRPTAQQYTAACVDGFKSGGNDSWVKRDGSLHCSYCGSLHPDSFMDQIRSGVEVGPTDKNYKVYLDGARTKFYPAHLTLEQAQAFRSLIQDGKVNIGYPGYFYNGIYLHPEIEEEAS